MPTGCATRQAESSRIARNTGHYASLVVGSQQVVPEGSAILISLHEHMKALPRPFDMDDALSQPYGMIPYV